MIGLPYAEESMMIC